MIGIKILCWIYVIFLVLVRLVNYDKTETRWANAARFTDNGMIVALLFILLFAHRF